LTIERLEKKNRNATTKPTMADETMPPTGATNNNQVTQIEKPLTARERNKAFSFFLLPFPSPHAITCGIV
jgi:hypothetical protein